MELLGGGLVGYELLVGIFAVGCAILFGYILKVFYADEEDEKRETKNESVVHSEKKAPTQSSKGKKKTSDNRWSGRSDKQAFAHPWLLTQLKGHTGQVLDMEFSSNGKYLASCAEDRAVMLWDVRDLTVKVHKSVRINIDYDYPTLIRWSPDVTAFIISKYNGNLEVYKVEKKKDGSLSSSGKVMEHTQRHEDDIIGMGISVTGKYMMTCSNKTDLLVSDLKGGEMARVDTVLMSTACAKISPCGRFIVASGFAPDVKVWEVIFTRIGEFQEVKRVFELTGHKSGVHDVAFDQDTSHMATITKSGTWHLFNTNIDYKRGENPRQVISGTYEQFSTPPKIALSPNAEVLVIASANNLYFYSTLDGKLDYVIEDIYNGNITAVLFDSVGKYVLTSGDKHIRVFHNVTGYRCNIVSGKEKLKHHPSSATKDRLQKLIIESEAFLKDIPEN